MSSKNLKILKNTISIGIPEPFQILHITDSHLTLDDPGWNRKSTFDLDYDGSCMDYLNQALDYAERNHQVILHTGDLIDFLSEGNFEWVDRNFRDRDYLYAAGNHDFFCYQMGFGEDYDYKWHNIKAIAPHLKSNLYFDSRVMHGVNFVTMDDSNYLIREGQLEALKAEVAKGYPIILCMHVPLYTPALVKTASEAPVAYVLAAPDDYLATYPEHRRLQQTPDEMTRKAVEYIRNEPLIRAVIAGHTHNNFEETLEHGMVQYVTHGTFAGYVRELTIC